MSLLTPTKLPYENAFSYGNENRRRNSRPRTDTAGHLSVRKLPGQDLRHVLYTITYASVKSYRQGGRNLNEMAWDPGISRRYGGSGEAETREISGL